MLEAVANVVEADAEKIPVLVGAALAAAGTKPIVGTAPELEAEPVTKLTIGTVTVYVE